MTFSSKINTLRPYNTQGNTRGNVNSSLESDRGRIINSAALRRLQQKTQVFPLERNAAVRSRLTHSLEVQQNGRFIAQSIIAELKKRGLHHYIQSNSQEDLESALVTLCEMACLMHDIGNPAFGHFGEAAINDWFKRYLLNHSEYNTSSHTALNATQSCELTLTEQLLLDVCSFEGNAQAIRIVHTLSTLNLTYSQTASILKYTRAATTPKSQVPNNKSYLQKKVGFYYSESKFVTQLWNTLNIEAGNRHPAAYIMEAADDIAYCLADMEDAVEKGIITVLELKGLLIDEYTQIVKKQRLNDSSYMKDKVDSAFKKAQINPANFENEFFIFLRVKLLHPLVTHATQRFVDNLDAIYHGHFNEALLEDNGYQHCVTQALKNVALKHVFSHKEVEQLELQGYKITSGILNEYQRVLDLSSTQFTDLLENGRAYPVEKRLVKRISKKFVAVYQQSVAELPPEHATNSIYEFYYRCRLLQDFISGMTDQFAYDTYRTLTVSE
ncbi:dGTPase [Pseudoalteromonas sp. MMG012]|uniref:dGTPase n=1 Tax=Pseudoalteromonas sp. MMG012 TaxID=2822686 RepID=UPI001B39D506|nr:dGTPase [Pseudoalteromonas sp. MMG012]MBQ4852813.1 dGTPase [Pseudoalteromonas sp. MMG012]